MIALIYWISVVAALVLMVGELLHELWKDRTRERPNAEWWDVMLALVVPLIPVVNTVYLVSVLFPNTVDVVSDFLDRPVIRRKPK